MFVKVNAKKEFGRGVSLRMFDAPARGQWEVVTHAHEVVRNRNCCCAPLFFSFVLSPV